MITFLCGRLKHAADNNHRALLNDASLKYGDDGHSSMKARIIALISFSLFLLISIQGFTEEAGYRDPEERTYPNLYVGIGFGYCTGGWYSNYRSPVANNWFRNVEKDSRGNFFHFGAGLVLSEEVHFGIDCNLFRVSSGDFWKFDDFSSGGDVVYVNLTSQNFIPSITLFPFGKGLYLKSGIGYSRLEAEHQVYHEWNYPDSRTVTYRGVAFQLATGILFGEKLHLGIGGMYVYNKYFTEDALPFDEEQYRKYPELREIPDNSHYWGIYVSLYLF